MTVSEVVKGDSLMLFDSAKKSFGGATSHTLTLTPNYNEVMCKDCGSTPWKTLSNVGWEISTENLYVASDYQKLAISALKDEVFTCYFGSSDWNDKGLAGLTGTPGYYTADTTGTLFYGDVKISSLTLTAGSGDNANYSATFTGSGALSYTFTSSGLGS